jgi:hypothetical protein
LLAILPPKYYYGIIIHRPIRGCKRLLYSGNVYNLQVDQDESYVANRIVVHNCAPIPKAISYADLGLDVPEQPLPKVEKGEDWFKRQPERVQREMMKPQRYEAWKKKEFDFRDLSQKYDDEVYGELLRETSLKALRDKRGGFVRPPA